MFSLCIGLQQVTCRFHYLKTQGQIPKKNGVSESIVHVKKHDSFSFLRHTLSSYLKKRQRLTTNFYKNEFEFYTSNPKQRVNRKQISESKFCEKRFFRNLLRFTPPKEHME